MSEPTDIVIEPISAPLIKGIGGTGFHSARTDADQNGQSLELGITDEKIVTIGGRPIAGVGGGNMIVLDGLTSTWWDIARAQVEGKTVYMSYGIPGLFSTITDPIKNSFGNMEAGNKLMSILRVWKAAKFAKRFDQFNLAFRSPADTIIEEGTEPVIYQEGYIPFTHDEATQLAEGTLDVSRFELYIYANDMVSENYDATYYTETYDFIPTDPDSSDYQKLLNMYDEWKLSNLVPNFKSSDEFLHYLVGYLPGQIPDLLLDKYKARFMQYNWAFRAPAGEPYDGTEPTVYQTGFTEFTEDEVIEMLTGNMPIERFNEVMYSEATVPVEYKETDSTILWDFNTWVVDHEYTESDMESWLDEEQAKIVGDIESQLTKALIGSVYDLLVPYEVDLEINLFGALKIGIGLEYKRGLPFVSPRYLVVGFPTSYAVDLKSMTEAGLDLSNLIDTLTGNGNNIQSGESIIGGLGGLLGFGKTTDQENNTEPQEVLTNASLKKGEVLRDTPDNEDSSDNEEENEQQETSTEPDPETLEAVLAGLTKILYDKDDEVFYLFALGMDLTRRVEEIAGQTIDPHTGFIINANGWNVFAPITGDANKGIMLDEYVDVIIDLLDQLENNPNLPDKEYLDEIMAILGDLMGNNFSKERIVEILREVNHMTLSFSSTLTQRAVYHLVDKGWNFSLLQYDKDTKRPYATSFMARVASQMPDITASPLDTVKNTLGTALAELAIKAMGSYYLGTILSMIGQIDILQIEALSEMAPFFAIEFAGVTEIPHGLDTGTHDVANVHSKIGIMLSTDESEEDADGGDMTNLATIGHIKVVYRNLDYLRSYVTINENTPFVQLYDAAKLGRGIIYENISEVESSDESDTPVYEITRLHGEAKVIELNDVDAVQLHINSSDGTVAELVGIPDEQPITPEPLPDKHLFEIGQPDGNPENAAVFIHGRKYSVSYTIVPASEVEAISEINSIAIKCISGASTPTRAFVGVAIKEIEATEFELDEYSNKLNYSQLPAIDLYNDLIGNGSATFNNGEWATVNLSTSFKPNSESNMLVVIISIPLNDSYGFLESSEPAYVSFEHTTNHQTAWLAFDSEDNVGTELASYLANPSSYPGSTEGYEYGYADGFTAFQVHIADNYNTEEADVEAKYGAGVNFGPIPINTFYNSDKHITYNYSSSYQIYPASYIGRGGLINSISFNYSPYWEHDTEMTRSLTVYLAETSYDSFLTKTDTINVNKCVKVYDSNNGDPDISFVARQWVNIPFSQAFDYNGVNNLLVIIFDNSGTRAKGSYTLNADTKNIQCIGWRSAMNPIDPSSPDGDPYQYECNALAKLHFAEIDDPSYIPDYQYDYIGEPITPDYDAIDTHDTDLVKWIVVSTETRSVVVNDIEQVFDAYNIFTPMGIDVYFQSIDHYGLDRILNDGPKSASIGLPCPKFKIFSVSKDYGETEIYGITPDCGSLSATQHNAPENSTYILGYTSSIGYTITYYKHNPILDWDRDTTRYDGSLIIDEEWYMDNLWSYAIHTTMTRDIDEPIIDVSAYMFSTLIEMGLVDLKVQYPINDDPEYAYAYLYSINKYDKEAVMKFCALIDDTGLEYWLMKATPIEVDESVGLFYIPYEIRLEENNISAQQAATRTMEEDGAGLYRTSHSIPPDQDISGYFANTEVNLEVDNNTVFFYEVFDPNTEAPSVEIDNLTYDGNDEINGYTQYLIEPINGTVATNITSMVIIPSGDIASEKEHQCNETKVYITNSTTYHYDFNISTSSPISGGINLEVYIGEHGNPQSPLIVPPGSTYLIEFTGPYYEFRNVSNIGMLPTPPPPPSTPSELL